MGTAERIIVALAKINQASIITADREIRDFYSDLTSLSVETREILSGCSELG